MIARAFTNVCKYFYLSQCVKPAPALSGATASPLSNFKRAAKRAAAASFVGCQVLKAATILKRSGSFIETFKGATIAPKI